MKDSQLKQLLNLIRRTGDRCVIADNETDEIFSIMTLPDYENLLNGQAGKDIAQLTEQEIIDKINRDIAYWKSSQPQNGGLPEFEIKRDQKTAISPQPAQVATEPAAGDIPSLGDVLKNKNYFSKNEEFEEDADKLRDDLKIIDDSRTIVKKEEAIARESGFGNFGVEESLADLPEDDIEEEKFFLEPIE